MADRPIKYEPHPVSKARKAELIAQGFRIIDAKFAPKGVTETRIEVAPPADDAFVAVGATRFGDGETQTEASLADARQAWATGGAPDPAPVVKPRGKPGRKAKVAK